MDTLHSTKFTYTAYKEEVVVGCVVYFDLNIIQNKMILSVVKVCPAVIAGVELHLSLLIIWFVPLAPC